MNDRRFPWLILIPMRPSITEVHQLNTKDQQALGTLTELTLRELAEDAGWGREVEIYWPVSKVRMNISSPPPVEHLVVFTPEQSDYFAIEPVSNCTDAFNLAAKGVLSTGMIELAPGAACKLEMNIVVGAQEDD